MPCMGGDGKECIKGFSIIFAAFMRRRKDDLGNTGNEEKGWKGRYLL